MPALCSQLVVVKQAVKQGKTAHTAKVASPNSVKLDSRKVNYEQRDLAYERGLPSATSTMQPDNQQLTKG